MSHYQNFKTVIYCVASGNEKETAQSLEAEIAFFQKYVGVDKVYLESYRDRPCSKEKLLLCKEKFQEAGIEVSGGITSVVPNLTPEDEKRFRLFGTFCFSNPTMRNYWKEMVEYTASFFDEFIIDDFYFTNCTCADCIREKEDRTWEEFRLAKMLDVSQNLTLAPARKINPKIKVTIKFPNWMESYQETGYNPEKQRDLFDQIYTGTETRHPSHTDQHLPRYLSYSIMRYMEHCAPGRNGGGWFDPYECYPIDCYLEQAYLTAFSKPKEIMLFCWESLYQNKLVTPLGFMLEKIDGILTHLGTPTGIPVYLPFNGKGEDHLEDYLGMLGIPFDPTPDFPQEGTVFLTRCALKDTSIVEKVKTFLAGGNRVIVTDGFVRAALGLALGMEDLTSCRDHHRRITAKDYHIVSDHHGAEHITGTELTFPVLEHANNASWSLMNAGRSGAHVSLLLRDHYQSGELLTLTLPDLYSDCYRLPREVLNKIRQEFCRDLPMWLDAPPQISLFLYDNDTFGIYSYTGDGCAPAQVFLHIRGSVSALERIGEAGMITPWRTDAQETVFSLSIEPGNFQFYRFSIV
jgi:hypothetical protein